MVMIVKLAGVFSVMAGIAVLIYGMGQGAIFWIALGGGGVINGAVFVCLADIVDHLAAIRQSLEERPR